MSGIFTNTVTLFVGTTQMDEFNDDTDGVVGVDGDLIDGMEGQDEPAEEADFTWYADRIAQGNYQRLGKALSVFGDLFRNPQDSGGLIRRLPDGKHAKITKAGECRRPQRHAQKRNVSQAISISGQAD